MSELRERRRDVTWQDERAAATLRYDPAAWEPVVERVEAVAIGARPDTVHRLRLRSTTRPCTVSFRFEPAGPSA